MSKLNENELFNKDLGFYIKEHSNINIIKDKIIAAQQELIDLKDKIIACQQKLFDVYFNEKTYSIYKSVQECTKTYSEEVKSDESTDE